MNEKKYVLTDETKVVNGITLHRIKYVKSFGYVKEGQLLGGWIESEENLSQEGICCVLNNAMVYGNANVHGDALVCGNAKVYDDVQVYGNAKVSGNASVYDNAHVSGNARVSGDAKVYGDAWLTTNSKVYGVASVFDDAHISDNAEVSGNAKVYGWAKLYGDAKVFGHARVCNNVQVCGNANVCDNAFITNNSDYLSVDKIGSRNGSTTFFKTKDNNIGVGCGCFKGTIEEFKKQVKETHKDTKYAKEYLALADLAELRLTEIKLNN